MFHLFTLISFIALYASAFSFGTLGFQFIGRFFPDVLSYGESFASGMGRNAIAGLIVAFPLYIFLMCLIWKETKGNAKNLASGVRIWFTYITLVVAAGIMLGDLIAVVSNLLGGELVVRFLLKAFTIFMITGAIFGYYLHDLKRKAEDFFSPIVKICAGIVCILVVVFIALGIVLTGTPGKQRAVQFDQRRVSDLQQISNAVDMYWNRTKALPGSLEDLKGQDFYVVSIQDPETGVPYEYVPDEGDAYSLCAIFKMGQVSNRNYGLKPAGLPLSSFSVPWDHDSGRVCFVRHSLWSFPAK